MVKNLSEGSNCIVLIFAKDFGEPGANGKDPAELPGLNLRLAVDGFYVGLEYHPKYICPHTCKAYNSH